MAEQPQGTKNHPHSFPAFPHLNVPPKTMGLDQKCLVGAAALGLVLYSITHQFWATIGSTAVAAILLNALLNDDPEIFSIAQIYLNARIFTRPRSPWFMDSPRKPGPRHKVLRFGK